MMCSVSKKVRKIVGIQHQTYAFFAANSIEFIVALHLYKRYVTHLPSKYPYGDISSRYHLCPRIQWDKAYLTPIQLVMIPTKATTERWRIQSVVLQLLPNGLFIERLFGRFGSNVSSNSVVVVLVVVKVRRVCGAYCCCCCLLRVTNATFAT
jgi:hypothetical protein